jgi:hypothetical protein
MGVASYCAGRPDGPCDPRAPVKRLCGGPDGAGCPLEVSTGLPWVWGSFDDPPLLEGDGGQVDCPIDIRIAQNHLPLH